MLRTKIICTLGPASDAAGVLQDMIRAGMTVGRLNMAHGELRNTRGGSPRCARRRES